MVGGQEMGEVVRNKGACGVLHVAVVADVAVAGLNEVRFVVLVKVVGQFHASLWRHTPFGFHASHKVSIAVG